MATYGPSEQERALMQKISSASSISELIEVISQSKVDYLRDLNNSQIRIKTR